MSDYKILKQFQEIESYFPIDRPMNKLIGALFAELVKFYLKTEGFCVTNRDIFIKGLPTEIDLMIVKKETRNKYDLIYDPNDILVVFELKKNGAYGKKDLEIYKNLFSNIRSLNKNIKCIYLTFTERTSYTYRITEEKLGFPVFELFPRLKGDFNYTNYTNSLGNWDKMVQFLKS